METLFLKGTEMKYTIKRHAAAKSIKIRILEGEILVTLPKNISTAAAKAFVEKQRDWILEHVQQQREKKVQQARTYQEGSRILYQGYEYPLSIVRIDAIQAAVQLENSNMKVFIPKQVAAAKTSSYIREVLISCYKTQAEIVFKQKAEHFAKCMQVQYNQIKIKDQKTKWGSCSSKKNINLNYRLLLAPTAVIDYVIVHELAHLVHMNHSKAFWEVVASILPEYQQQERWLKKHGSELVL